MKELLASYAAYNNWANQQLLNIVVSLSEEQQQQPIVSSFPSLYKTFLHLWGAENIWWQRLNLHEQTTPLNLLAPYSMQEIATGLLQQDKQWINWVNDATELQLQQMFAYYNMKKEYFEQPLWQAVHHLFNHSTYHRGQVVTMLRQVKVEHIPQTDYIAYSRGK